nr:riboflavin kinase [Pseudonocardia sp. ICBG601]
MAPYNRGARRRRVRGPFVIRDRELPAAISIGTNPTFSGRERTVEAYVLDVREDFYYGFDVAVDFAAAPARPGALRRRPGAHRADGARRPSAPGNCSPEPAHQFSRSPHGTGVPPESITGMGGRGGANEGGSEELGPPQSSPTGSGSASCTAPRWGTGCAG